MRKKEVYRTKKQELYPAWDTFLRKKEVGAGDEARTRYLHLGKVALYRMSYARITESKEFRGAPGRSRTNDTRIFNPLLYQLSYRGIKTLSATLVGTTGLEPVTLCL